MALTHIRWVRMDRHRKRLVASLQIRQITVVILMITGLSELIRNTLVHIFPAYISRLHVNGETQNVVVRCTYLAAGEKTSDPYILWFSLAIYMYYYFLEGVGHETCSKFSPANIKL